MIFGSCHSVEFPVKSTSLVFNYSSVCAGSFNVAQFVFTGTFCTGL